VILEISLPRALAVAVALPLLGIGLYKRWVRIVQDHRSQIQTGAPLAKTRAALVIAAVGLFVIIVITAVAGAAIGLTLALLYVFAGIVALHLIVSVTSGWRQGGKGRQ